MSLLPFAAVMRAQLPIHSAEIGRREFKINNPKINSKAVQLFSDKPLAFAEVRSNGLKIGRLGIQTKPELSESLSQMGFTERPKSPDIASLSEPKVTNPSIPTRTELSESLSLMGFTERPKSPDIARLSEPKVTNPSIPTRTELPKLAPPGSGVQQPQIQDFVRSSGLKDSNPGLHSWVAESEPSAHFTESRSVESSGVSADAHIQVNRPLELASLVMAENPDLSESGFNFDVQIVQTREGSLQSETPIPGFQAETSFPSTISFSAVDLMATDKETPTAEFARVSNGSVAQDLESEVTPEEPGIVAGETESSLPSSDESSESHTTGMHGDGSGQAGRSSASSAKLDSPSGGSTATPGHAFFLSGKGAVKTGSADHAKAKTAAAKGAPHPGSALKSTVDTAEPEVSPTVEKDSVPVKDVKDLHDKIQQPATARHDHLKLEHIKNLQDLAEKIQARAQMANPTREALLVRLNPPHLGLLRVQVETRGQELRLVFNAQTPEAVQALKDSRPELTQMVSDQGYTLTRCEVDSQPMPDRRAEGYSADQPKRPSPDSHNHRDDTTTSNEAEDRSSEKIQHLDLGYNTLDLVA
jgi:flagellar hook-length control protein FliK